MVGFLKKGQKFEPFQTLFMYGFTSLMFFMAKSIFFDHLVLDFSLYSWGDIIVALLNGLSFGFIQGKEYFSNLSNFDYGYEIRKSIY